MIENYKFEIGIKPYPSAQGLPQQILGLLDCGILVMYYMEKLCKQKNMKKTLTKGEVLKYRAQLVKLFINNRHSWNNIHKQL
ncbi:hypothetical protein ACLB2K_049663 [Fragaria x ananassa]